MRSLSPPVDHVHGALGRIIPSSCHPADPDPVVLAGADRGTDMPVALSLSTDALVKDKVKGSK